MGQNDYFEESWKDITSHLGDVEDTVRASNPRSWTPPPVEEQSIEEIVDEAREFHPEYARPIHSQGAPLPLFVAALALLVVILLHFFHVISLSPLAVAAAVVATAACALGGVFAATRRPHSASFYEWEDPDDDGSRI